MPYYNDLSVEPMQLRVYKRRYAVIDSNALIEMMESENCKCKLDTCTVEIS